MSSRSFYRGVSRSFWGISKWCSGFSVGVGWTLICLSSLFCLLVCERGYFSGGVLVLVWCDGVLGRGYYGVFVM